LAVDTGEPLLFKETTSRTDVRPALE